MIKHFKLLAPLVDALNTPIAAPLNPAGRCFSGCIEETRDTPALRSRILVVWTAPIQGKPEQRA